jgi:hypothetical protein
VEDLLETILSTELAPSEGLLWSGKPHGGIRLRGTDGLMIPVSIFWCGFAIFWETAVVANRAPFFFTLWGIPFVLAGFYLVFGRFLVDALVRSRTVYGVTNERILIVSTWFGRRVRSIGLRALSDISMSQRSDGSGTITFGPVQSFGQAFGLGSRGNRHSSPSFEMIQNVKSVYQLIVSAQKQLVTA